MTFRIYTSTGQRHGPFGSLVIAQKNAIAKLLEDKRIQSVELRPSASSVVGGYGPNHRGSFYKTRLDL